MSSPDKHVDGGHCTPERDEKHYWYHTTIVGILRYLEGPILIQERIPLSSTKALDLAARSPAIALPCAGQKP